MSRAQNILVLGLDKPYFQDKFDHLYSKHQNISFYISWNPIESNLKISSLNRIDSSLLYNQEKVFDAYKLNRKTVLDKPFLHNMHECETVFFSTIDRCSVFPKKISDHKNYFYDLLIFFKSFFEENNNIDHVFFPTTPHFPVDIVLFYICKYFSINTIILNRTDFNNKFYFRSDWRKTPDFNNRYNYKSIKGISTKDLRNDSAFVKHSKNLNNASLNNFNKSKSSIRNFTEYFQLFRLSLYYFKHNKSASPFHLSKELSWIKIFNKIIIRHNQNKILTKFYQSKMSIPDLSVDYLYFPLHFQPERSTDPEGLYFSNQLRAIELLRKNLDSSVRIYVKEHPRQFDQYGDADLRKLSSRTKVFYEKILDLKETYLVDLSFSSDALIKNSKIISTITGSSGWEGIKNLKPVIVFGKPWYTSYKWCYHVSSDIEVKEAINKAENIMHQVKIEDLHEFIEKINSEVFDGYIGSVYFNNEVDYRLIIKCFTENLMIYINSTGK